jgi:ComEC/Rec2-related protein
MCAAILLFLSRFDPDGRSNRIALLTSSTALIVLLYGSLNPLGGVLERGGMISVKKQRYEAAGAVGHTRRYVETVLEDGRLSPESSGMLKALLLADRSGLGWKTVDSWRASGVAHYLAMSGMHLGLIATPLFLLLTLIGARGIIRDSCGILVLSFYTALAGMPGSLLRALALIASIRLYRLRGTRSGLASGALTCGFIVFTFSPGSAIDTGFILSLTAVFGIALIGLPVSDLLRKLCTASGHCWIIECPLRLLVLSACIQAFILPLTAELFGISPLAGPFMSLLLAVPVICILYAGMTFAAAGHLVSSMTAPPIDFIVSVANGIAGEGASYSGIGITPADFSASAYISGLAICSAAFRVRDRRLLILAAGLAVMAGSFLPAIRGADKGAPRTETRIRKNASLHGGEGGVLVLSRWLYDRTAAGIIRDLRLTGIRRIGTIVVLEPVSYRIDDTEPLIRDLAPALVLISPWSDAAFAADVSWAAVRSDTLLETEGGSVVVYPPSVIPGPGSIAPGEDSYLSISPLD